MRDSQKHQIHASEIRTRLATIAGLPDDGMTAEIRTEADTLTTEYRDVETRHLAVVDAVDVRAVRLGASAAEVIAALRVAGARHGMLPTVH